MMGFEARWLAVGCRAVAGRSEPEFVQALNVLPRCNGVPRERGMAKRELRSLRYAVAVGAVVAVLGVAYADGSAVMDRARPEYDAKGIPLGAFRLFPTLDLRLATTNNVFETESGEKSDVYVEVAPAFKLVSGWSRHLLELYGALSTFRFADFDGENVTNWALGAEGRLDIQRGSALLAGLSRSTAHEGRASPNSPGNIKEPIRYDQFHAHGGVSIQPNKVGFFLGGDYDEYAYDAASLNGGGFLSNRDRDRTEYGVRARVSLELSQGYLAFVEAGYGRREFDLAIDRTGVNRDSKGTSLNAGIEFKLDEFLQGEAFVGFLDRQFGAPLQDFSGFNYGAALRWSATPLTTVRLDGARVLNETVIGGASVIAEKRIGVGLDHELRRNLIVQADVAHVDSEFVGSPREDSALNVGVGATYLIDENWRATARYEHRERESNAPGEDLSEDKFSIGLRFQL